MPDLRCCVNIDNTSVNCSSSPAPSPIPSFKPYKPPINFQFVILVLTLLCFRVSFLSVPPNQLHSLLPQNQTAWKHSCPFPSTTSPPTTNLKSAKDYDKLKAYLHKSVSPHRKPINAAARSIQEKNHRRRRR